MVSFDKIEMCVVEAYRARGDAFLSDARMAKSILHDLLPRGSRERHMLELAIDEGVFTLIEQYKSAGGNIAACAEKAINLLTGTGFVEESAARTLVNSLFFAICGVKLTGGNLHHTNDEKTAKKKNASTSSIQQDSSLSVDYELVKSVRSPVGKVKAGNEVTFEDYDKKSILAVAQRKGENGIYYVLTTNPAKEIINLTAPIRFSILIYNKQENAFRNFDGTEEIANRAELLRMFRGYIYGHGYHIAIGSDGKSRVITALDSLIKAVETRSTGWLDSLSPTNADAQANLAILYQRVAAKEANPDYSQAFYWAQRAAELSEERGLYLLGFYFYYGLGTEKDEQKARYYCQRAVMQGDGQGSRAAKALLEKMNT